MGKAKVCRSAYRAEDREQVVSCFLTLAPTTMLKLTFIPFISISYLYGTNIAKDRSGMSSNGHAT